MTPEHVIQCVEEYYGEWIEMSEDPATMVAGILAHKLVELLEYITYLERTNGIKRN